jgi:adenylate kinase
MLNIVLFGPPGAGKGTQSQKLISEYDLIHISTGDLLRAERAAQTPLGIKASQLMDQGMLVPDEVVIGMIRSKVDSNKQAKGFIFDGFPRTVAQAEALDKLLEEFKVPLSGMIALEVEKDELVKRLLNRGMESGRPDDANESIIEKRVEEYNSKTMPVADYYRKQGKFASVNGIGTIDSIFASLREAINKLKK